MNLLRELDVPHWVESFVVALTIDYLLKSGDLFQAEALLDERDLPVPCRFSYPNEIEYLARARYLIYRGRGEEAQAMDKVLPVLERAEPEGYRRLFLDETGVVVPLLERARAVVAADGAQLKRSADGSSIF